MLVEESLTGDEDSVQFFSLYTCTEIGFVCFKIF